MYYDIKKQWKMTALFSNECLNYVCTTAKQKNAAVSVGPFLKWKAKLIMEYGLLSQW